MASLFTLEELPRLVYLNLFSKTLLNEWQIRNGDGYDPLNQAELVIFYQNKRKRRRLFGLHLLLLGLVATIIFNLVGKVDSVTLGVEATWIIGSCIFIARSSFPMFFENRTRKCVERFLEDTTSLKTFLNQRNAVLCEASLHDLHGYAKEALVNQARQILQIEMDSGKNPSAESFSRKSSAVKTFERYHTLLKRFGLILSPKDGNWEPYFAIAREKYFPVTKEVAEV